MTPLGPAGPPESRRARTYHIIFGHESKVGSAFDIALIVAIGASVAAVMLDSVESWRDQYGSALNLAEWLFTIVFTVEYGLRLWCVNRPRNYALSFFGLIDLASVLPSYLSVLLPGGQFLSVVRILRVMRIFRVLKLVRFIGEASVLGTALRASRYKISVFLLAVLSIVVVVGSLMYLVEGPASGFTSIPRGVYWSVVTLTTVGYGDIAPITPLGQAMASIVMILGYGIIAVPTGIVSAELAAIPRSALETAHACPECPHLEADRHAEFCRKCGARLAGTGNGAYS